MSRAKDLTGQTFADGSIVVLRRAENGKTRNSRWLCQCKCGNTFVEYGLNLKNGNRQSCGCQRKGSLAGETMTDEQMKRPSTTLYKLKRTSNPYQDLANAIVAVAVDDYRTALQEDDAPVLKSLERFFRSDWYRMLTNISPDALLSYLNREYSGSLNAVYV